MEDQENKNQEKTCLDSKKKFFKRSHFATDSFEQVKQTAPIDHLKMSCLKNTSDSEMASSCLENQSFKTEQEEEGENQTQEEQVKQTQENQKSEKLKLLKKLEGKSSRQTEQLLQEIDPTIQKSKRKVRHLNQDQVEVKIVLSKKAYEGIEQLKYLLSHRNLSEGEIFSLLINLGLEKYDPRKYKTREDKKPQSKQTQFATDSTVKKSQVTFDKKPQSKQVELGIEILSKNTYYTQNVVKTLSQNNQNRITPDASKTKFQYISEKTKIKERIKNHEELTARNSQNNHEELTTRNSQNNHEELTARNSQNKSLNTKNTHHHKKQTPSQNTCSMTIKSQVDLGFKKYKPKNKKIRPQQAIQKTNSIKKISRYISTKTRKQVWLRDEGRCTYTCQETKRRCHSQHFLQIDHIQPYALGGNHEVKNLRLLCANHNQYRK